VLERLEASTAVVGRLRVGKNDRSPAAWIGYGAPVLGG
jgi:hypothetical protein